MSRSDVDLPRLKLDAREVDAELRNALEGATLTRTIDGASTLELAVRDPDRQLIRSRVFAGRTVATVDGYLLELVKVAKSGSSVTVVLEDATVADLRRATGALSARAGTTTVDAFARRLLTPGAKLVAQPGQRNKAPLMRGTDSDKRESSWQALQRLAEERGWRAFVDRRTVHLGGDAWLLKRTPPLVVREHTAGVDEVNYDADAGKYAADADLVADAARWAAPPGTPVDLRDLGLGSGVWLVREVSRSLFSTRTSVRLTRRQPELPEPKPEPREPERPAPRGTPAADSGGDVTTGRVSSRGYTWPLSGRLTSGYGQRGGRLHAGVDLAVPIGTPVRAARAGTVLHAGAASGYGIAVYIDHGDAVTRYGHLSRVECRRGEEVKRGERIALSGNTGRSTGPHLHFEVRPGNVPRDPLDYLPPRR